MKITVNGNTIDVPDGSSVSVVNNEVIVNGSSYSVGSDLKIRIGGIVGNVSVDRGSVSIDGDVKGDVKAGGSVTCRNVTGSVDAGGSVQCGSVGLFVDAGDSVQCGSVGGDVDAGGSVRHG